MTRSKGGGVKEKEMGEEVEVVDKEEEMNRCKTGGNRRRIGKEKWRWMR